MKEKSQEKRRQCTSAYDAAADPVMVVPFPGVTQERNEAS